MTMSANKNDSLGNLDSSSSNASNPSNGIGFNYGQVSGGPAAILSTLLTEMQHLYSEIMEQYNAIAQLETEVQGQAALAASNASIASGVAQANSTKMDGIMSAVSAGLTGAVGVATYAIGQKSYNDDLTKSNTKLNNLKDLSKTIGERLTDGRAPVAAGNMDPSTGSTPQADTYRQDIINRNFDFLEGNDYNPTAAKEALAKTHIQDLKNLDQGVDIKGSVEDEINNMYEHLNTVQNQKTAVSTYGTMIKDTVNGAVSAGVTAKKADYQAEQGQEQGNQTIASQAQQSAGSAAETARQFVSKEYDALAQAISAFRAAAQAYPQG